MSKETPHDPMPIKDDVGYRCGRCGMRVATRFRRLENEKVFRWEHAPELV